MPSAKRLLSIGKLTLVFMILLSLSVPEDVRATLLLEKDRDNYLLNAQLEYFEDKSGTLLFEQVREEQGGLAFTRSRSDISARGYSDSAIWMRLKVENINHEQGVWRLVHPISSTNYLDAYIPIEGGYRKFETGNRRPFITKDVKTHHFAFRVSLNDMSSGEYIYLRVKTAGKMNLKFNFQSIGYYEEYESRHQFFKGIFYGCLFLILCYTLILGAYSRDKLYLYYAGYLLCIGLTSGLINGYYQQYINNNFVWAIGISYSLSITLTSALLLSNYFLELKDNNPSFYFVGKSLVVLSIVYLFCLPVFPLSKVIFISIFTSLASAVYIPVVGIYRWNQGFKPARAYTVSWLFFALANTLVILPELSNDTRRYEDWVDMALILQMMFIAMAVGDQVNRAQGEKTKFKQKLVESQFLLVESLRKSDKLKNSFLSSITHELLTPINGIRLSLGLMKSETPGLSDEYLEAAISSNQNMFDLVETMITFTEARNGCLINNKKVLEIRVVMQEVLMEFTDSNKKKIDFSCSFGEEFEDFVVADEKKIRMIIRQLLKNAVAFTKQGKIVLACHYISPEKVLLEEAEKPRAHSDEGLAMLEISVTDTGSGIPADVQETIVKAFYQVDASITRQHGGLGIGLTLVHDLLQLIDGCLSIESQVGEGSTFKTLIPIGLPSSIDKATYLKHKEISTAEYLRLENEVNKHRFKNAKILVVEDNQVNMNLMLKLLQKAEYQTLAAEHGAEALALLELNDDVAAVLMDCQMPVMDGFEATAKIRGKEKFKNLPIIAVTANVSEEDRNHCWEVGMSDYLAKPVQKNAIEATLIKWLS